MNTKFKKIYQKRIKKGLSHHDAVLNCLPILANLKCNQNGELYYSPANSNGIYPAILLRLVIMDIVSKSILLDLDSDDGFKFENFNLTLYYSTDNTFSIYVSYAEQVFSSEKCTSDALIYIQFVQKTTDYGNDSIVHFILASCNGLDNSNSISSSIEAFEHEVSALQYFSDDEISIENAASLFNTFISKICVNRTYMENTVESAEVTHEVLNPFQTL